ncbi:Ammonia channel precursor [Aquisphaera giovannonii]|uniref:Ammonium transporter n=1 Tax=Aquisphaera giovannonii TaxID=406548 RepID=A0A5B9W0H6_9BACT|nr:ammonium transporter [Aquisphaera giovannonii]QEH34033.1 Ammonia channel precursor [Aquisphaera giovannonii]
MKRPLSRRLVLGLAMFGWFGLVTLWNGAPAAKGQAPDAPAATTPAPAAPAAPDVTKPAASPDSTGNYTGAGTTGALTLADGKSSLDTVTRDVAMLKINGNMLWALIAGFLVMFMQAGFALVETGLCRAKNVAHTMAMNIAIYGIGMLGYFICGFALQMGGFGPIGVMNGPDILHNMVKFELFGKPFEVLGYSGFFLAGDANDMSVLTLFLFQMVFMDTTATIPTGALAERWKFSAFVAYGFVLSMLIYPVYGCWVWGGGWLADLGVNFGLGNGHIDFAGSSVVHMTGGVTALAGAIILGPRIGKFNKDGSANAIPGHNIAMVVLGTLILAFGWFGFNGGSTLALADGRIASVCVCTMLAGSAGFMTAQTYMWMVFGKPDPTMACNGLLAGLVAITAPCAFVNPITAVIIGGIAGVLVIWSVLFVERVLKLDDPVGAISVHGVCGAFGCLMIGLFADGKYGAGWNGVADKAPLGLFYGGGVGQLTAQAIGVAANVLWVFPVAYISFFVIEKTIGNRVPAKDEIEGLDIPEMGVLGYVNEDPIIVKNAGAEHISTHGPGVPSSLGKAETKAPVHHA